MRTKSIKYLGVTLDENLNFKQHATNLTKKIANRVSFFARISKCLTPKTKIIIYNTIIKPHFEYCSSVLFLLNNSEIYELQKLQNKTMRIILKRDRYANIAKMLNDLKFLSVRQSIFVNVMIIIFKIRTKKMPNYLISKTKLIRQTHNRNTRNVNNFSLPNLKTAFARNNIFYEGISMFNALPIQIKNETNFNRFKILLKMYAKSNV